MGRRKYFIISVVLAVCAISSDFAAKGYYSRSMVILADVVAGYRDMAEAKANSHELARKGGMFQISGFAFAVLTVVFWVSSGFWRGKRLWQWVPLVLLIVYLLLQLMIV